MVTPSPGQIELRFARIKHPSTLDWHTNEAGQTYLIYGSSTKLEQEYWEAAKKKWPRLKAGQPKESVHRSAGASAPVSAIAGLVGLTQMKNLEGSVVAISDSQEKLSVNYAEMNSTLGRIDSTVGDIKQQLEEKGSTSLPDPIAPTTTPPTEAFKPPQTNTTSTTTTVSQTGVVLEDRPWLWLLIGSLIIAAFIVAVIMLTFYLVNRHWDGWSQVIHGLVAMLLIALGIILIVGIGWWANEPSVPAKVEVTQQEESKS